MMDALNLPARPAADAAVPAQGSKPAKGDDNRQKSGFSDELKNVRNDRDQGRRGREAENTAAKPAASDTASEAAPAGKPGLGAFSALKGEWQAAVEAVDGQTGEEASAGEGREAAQIHKKNAIIQGTGRKGKGDFSGLGEDGEKTAIDSELTARIARTAEECMVLDGAVLPDAVSGSQANAVNGASDDAQALDDVLSLLAGNGAAGAPSGRKTASAEGRETKQAGAVTGRAGEAGLETDGEAGEVTLADADQDRLFRLQRGDSGKRSMDMHIGRDANGGLEVEARRAGPGQAETVNVLDARRYLGFNAPSNSSSLTAAMAGNDEWVSAMHPSARLANEAQLSSTGQVVNTLKLELNPVSLGTVTATLRLAGDELSVHLTVHTAAAYRELSDDASGMMAALRSQGFSVDQVTVSMGASSSQQDGSNDAGGSFAQQQQNMQQMAGQGGRGGGEGARQDARSGGSDGPSGVTNGRTNETQQGSGGMRGAGSARPDHVYI